MIIDASAIIAILRDEPEAAAFANAIESAGKRRMSAVNFLEAAIIIEGTRDPVARRKFDDFVAKAGIAIEPVTQTHVRIAREAYRDYGTGSGHPAGLNLGDCFAYALARATGSRLLFKGNDFTHTDIRPAVE